MAVEVILKQDVIGLGDEGEICKVKDGYARNFLLPKQFAVIKSPVELKKLERQRAEIEKRRAEKVAASKGVADKVHGQTITIKRLAGENDKLYGSVTSTEVATLIRENLGIEVDKRKIIIKAPIKSIGSFDLDLKLLNNVNAKFKLIIEKEGADEEIPGSSVNEESPVSAEASVEDSSSVSTSSEDEA